MFLFVFLCLLVLITFHNFYYKRRNLPPGPLPLPFVGNLLSVLWAQLWHGFPEKAFLNWRKDYGSVFTYWMGGLPVVVVADFETIRNSFGRDGDAYSQRPSFADSFHRLTRGGTLGIISNSGHVWQEHRRFAIHAFKDLGMGNEICEKKILTEVSAMISALKKHLVNGQCKYLIPNEHVDLALGSIINSILFGRSFFHEEDMPHFLRLKDLMVRFFGAFSNPLILPCLSHPYLFTYLPLFSGAICELRFCFHQLFKVFDAEISSHKKQRETSPYNHKPMDFLHAYLKKAESQETKHRSHSFSQEQLRNVCFDLWVAGQENVSTTLAWGIAHMLHNPSIQKQLHTELDQKTSSSCFITWNDRKQLPFTNAVVAEFQRIANLVPQNLLHSTSREVIIDGIKIPAGTTIVPQISAVLYDHEVFVKPLHFNPSRFLDKFGQFTEAEQFIPFSVGKRRCAGEQLARMELFLFVANLFRCFELLPSHELPSLRRTFGPAAQCPSFSCIFKLWKT